MKRSKLFVLSLATPMLLLGTLTSCGAKQTGHEKFIKSSDLGYLYEVTYHDYSWSDVSNWMESNTPNNDGAGFGCSSVHNGNFYGRSFDFCYTDMCEFLVRTKHENGHFASIGISIADCNVNEEKVEKINNGTGGEKEKLNEKMIPFAVVDGINEYGVVCNTNVVPAKDLTPHSGESLYFTHGTKPGATDLFYQFMPRYILDNATSAAHAVQLLDQHNLTAMNKKGKQRDYLGVSNMGYELHCMIADKNETYIVEMMDDHLNIIKSYDKLSSVMTNYYCTNKTPSSAGVERHDILCNGYDAVDDIGDMKDLIKEVQYSPCYKTTDSQGADLGCPVWPTEFAGSELIGEGGKHLNYRDAKQYCTDHWSEIKDDIQDAYNTTQDPEGRADSPGPLVPWISTHAEAYDIEKRELNLVTQEDYTNWINYKL